MALISIRKTAAIEPSPTDTVSLYVDASDNHLKQIDETGEIIDLTDGSATSSPNAASLIDITLETLVVDIVNEGLINPKACYRITDSAAGIIRVWGKSATELTATAMKEGTDDGAGTVTAGEWGNYDLDADVFTSQGATSGTYTPTISDIASGSTITVLGDGFYHNIGGIVSGAIFMRVEMASATEGFKFDFPIEPTNVLLAYSVNYNWSTKTPTDEYTLIEIANYGGDKLGAVQIIAAGTVAIDLSIWFIYNADN
jgi:hypothetical protein